LVAQSRGQNRARARCAGPSAAGDFAHPTGAADQNRKFTPPRTRSALKLLVVGDGPHVGLQATLPRSTCRYSPLAVQPPPSANSSPPPTVQPACVSLEEPKPATFALMSPTASPPVT